MAVQVSSRVRLLTRRGWGIGMQGWDLSAGRIGAGIVQNIGVRSSVINVYHNTALHSSSISQVVSIVVVFDNGALFAAVADASGVILSKISSSLLCDLSGE